MQEATSSRKTVQWLGMLAGPLLAAVCLYLLPTQYLDPNAAEPGASAQFSWAGRATLAVMVWMGVWWLTEAIDISATALLPVILFPLAGVATIKEASFPYADPLIFLYLGGFIIALSMDRWGLGKRIALLTLRMVGTSAGAMIAGFMLVTAVLSAFVSNTATTAMMLPIALSVVALVRQQDKDHSAEHEARVSRFATCLLLAIAYAASVGGVATIIGTPTNAFLIGFLRSGIDEPYRHDFSFASWLPIGASITVIFLPVIYLVLTKLVFPFGKISIQGGKQLIAEQLREMGAIHRGEWNTLIVFVCTVALWLTRPLLNRLTVEMGGQQIQPLAALSDTGIAMLAAVSLFMIPIDRRARTFTMDWPTVQKLPWGVLYLFGGGLSLAAAVKANGVAEFIGSWAQAMGNLPVILLVLIITTAIVFLTELTSNVATTTSLVPVLAAIAPGVGVHPYLLIIPATLAASCAFMLPVATPPNAIVFGSGAITVPQMVRAGFVLNLLAIVIVALVAFAVVRPWMGI